MNTAQIFDFFSRLAEANPAPQTELEYGSDYQLLVAVVLSAQATDVGVNKATRAPFGQEAFAVDTHIFRVGNRTGLAPGKTVLAVEQKLDKRVPAPFRRDAHHWLILHGRYVCKARRPECWRCIVADLCRYKPKTLAPGATSGTAAARARSRPVQAPSAKS